MENITVTSVMPALMNTYGPLCISTPMAIVMAIMHTGGMMTCISPPLSISLFGGGASMVIFFSSRW